MGEMKRKKKAQSSQKLKMTAKACYPFTNQKIHVTNFSKQRLEGPAGKRTDDMCNWLSCPRGTIVQCREWEPNPFKS